jgi:hypothetical protein
LPGFFVDEENHQASQTTGSWSRERVAGRTAPLMRRAV